VRTLLLRTLLSGRGKLIAVGSLVLALAAASSATAQESGAQEPSEVEVAAARDFGRAGVALYQQGKFADALDRFQRAEKLVGPLPTTLLWQARCLAKLGRLIEASERYRTVMRTTLAPDAPEQHVAAVNDARAEGAPLIASLPKVTITVEGPDFDPKLEARAELDGKPISAATLGVPVPVDPGPHRIVVTQGAFQGDASFSAEVGKESRATVLLRAMATKPVQPIAVPPNRSPHSAPDVRSSPHAATIVGGIGIALGGGALIMGGVTAGLAASLRGKLRDACPDNQCQPEQHADVDSYNLDRKLSTAGFVAGGVLLAGGITAVLLAPKPTGTRRGWTPLLWPGGAGIAGEL
jgi:hypothetical protein